MRTELSKSPLVSYSFMRAKKCWKIGIMGYWNIGFLTH
jgi:hypothetical protein